jgi:hypothetical protein
MALVIVIQLRDARSEIQKNQLVEELNGLAINNRPSGFIEPMGRVASLTPGGASQQGQPNIGDKFQVIDPAARQPSQQQAKTEAFVGFSTRYAPHNRSAINNPAVGFGRVVVDGENVRHLEVFIDGSWQHSPRCRAYTKYAFVQ